MEVCGDEIRTDPPTRAIVEELQRTQEPFFLIPDLARRSSAENTWRDLLGDRVVCLEHPDDTCLVAAGLVALNEGLLDLDQIASTLSTHHRERVGRIARALMPFAASLNRDGSPAVATDTRSSFLASPTQDAAVLRLS
jgi:hypothetical protein